MNLSNIHVIHQRIVIIGTIITHLTISMIIIIERIIGNNQGYKAECMNTDVRCKILRVARS